MAATKKLTRTKVVYLAFTLHSNGETTLLRIYSKSSYQTAYNWLADIADREGGKVIAGDGVRAVQTYSPTTGQIWYLERHEVL